MMAGQIFLLVLVLFLVFDGITSKDKPSRTISFIWATFILGLAGAVHFWQWRMQIVVPFALVGTLLYTIITRATFKRLNARDRASFEQEMKQSHQKLTLGIIFIVGGLLGYLFHFVQPMMLGFCAGGFFMILDFLWERWTARSIEKGKWAA